MRDEPKATWPSSVWEGSDSGFLSWAIPFYLRVEPLVQNDLGIWNADGFHPSILDATYGLGTFWKHPEGLKRFRNGLSAANVYRPFVYAIDRDPAKNVDAVMDNRYLGFRDQTFDVVIYDPPHMDDVGASSNQINRYAANPGGYDLFFFESFRVLKPTGIVLAKVADQIHGGRAHFQHIHMMQSAERAGFWCCDLVVKIRKSAIMDPKWKNPMHSRKRHSFWLCFRKGDTC